METNSLDMFAGVKPNFLWNLLRSILSLLDRIVYQLLVWVYELFFNVASSNILADASVVAFFKRVFLIIGVFMLFKLAFSLLSSVVNPDVLTDKEKGFGKIISRALIMLILLTLLIPTGGEDFDAPSSANPNYTNSYEYKIKSQGLLFGTLYTLQDRILSENVIGKLIVGSSSDNNSEQETELKDVGQEMSMTILNVFFSPKSCATPIETDTVAEKLNSINDTCSKEDTYAYSYFPLVSTIVGGILVFIIFSFVVDVAVRTVKLAVLRLIAPIPVISYIDPKSSKDGAFASWTKSLTSTYLDLFVRLIVIYFAVYVVSQMVQNGIDVAGDGIIKALTTVFLIIGVFFFAKQAPNFIKDVLGIKSQGGGSIGLASMMAGAGALAGGVGLAGAGAAMLQNANAAGAAAAQGKQISGGWGAGRDLAAQITTGNKDAHGGMVNNLQQRALRRSQEKAATKAGVSQENIDAQKGIVANKAADMQNAEAQMQNARAEWASYDVGQDPGEWTGGAGPSMPEASQYNQDGAFDEAGYNGAMETYYQQKSEYDTKHAQWEKQSQEYANRVAEKERLRQARDNAARDYASKKDSYEDSARTLDDAKESRNSYVAKKNKYSSDNKFNPR